MHRKSGSRAGHGEQLQRRPSDDLSGGDGDIKSNVPIHFRVTVQLDFKGLSEIRAGLLCAYESVCDRLERFYCRMRRAD
jgi:hypothetical protein